MSTSCPIAECQHCPTRTFCVARFIDEEKLSELPTLFHVGCAYHAGGYLFTAGESVGDQFHIRSGMIKTYFINSEGSEFVTGFYLPGEVVQQAGLEGVHLQSAVALDTSTVCRLNIRHLKKTASKEVAMALCEHAESLEVQTLSHQLNLKSGSAASRFAGFCTQMADRLHKQRRAAHHIPTPMTRTDIASYLGLTLESLSRVMSKLKTTGIIHAEKTFIEIKKPETLAMLATHLS